MNADSIELTDLGDATEETKQYMPFPYFRDSAYFKGVLPDLG